MAPRTGPQHWNQPILGGERYLMGRELTSCPIAVQASGGASGIGIEMMAGGMVYQRTPAHIRAPLSLEGETFSLEFQADSEMSWHAWQAAYQVAQVAPVEFWHRWAREDAWVIRDAATTWTLSRTLPYGLISAAAYPPRAFLRDLQGGAEEELTLITAGTPGAGELKYNPSANSITVETGDLSAEVGRVLAFRYYPLRLVRFDSAPEQDFSGPNELNYSVELIEHVPERIYS